LRNVAFSAVLGLAAALVGAIALELRAVPTNGEGVVSAPEPSQPLQVRSRPGAAVSDVQRSATVAAIFARPLFSPGRRPAAGPVASAAPAAVLPRLTATSVHGPDRSTILVLAGGGKPVVAHEGAEVGGYTVQAIQPGRVTLSGPDGSHVLRPTFDPSRPAGDPQASGIGVPALPPGAHGPAALNLQGLPGHAGFAGLPLPPGASTAR